MLIPEIIRKKRDGHALSTAEIQRFIQGVTEGEVTDAQIAAFAMAMRLLVEATGGLHSEWQQMLVLLAVLWCRCDADFGLADAAGWCCC